MGPKKMARLENQPGLAHAFSDMSLNPILAMSGPRAGLLSFCKGMQSVRDLEDLVDSGVYRILESAWDEVGVPVSLYWGYKPQPSVPFWLSSSLSAAGSARATPAACVAVKLPDAHFLQHSFYASRVESMTARGYAANRGMILVAVDTLKGTGSKLFNVLPRYVQQSRNTENPGINGEGSDLNCKEEFAGASSRQTAEALPRMSAVAEFIRAVRRPYQRNLYVLIDEDAAVDPYFDIDCAYTVRSDITMHGNQNNGSAFREAFPFWNTLPSGPPTSVPESQVEELLFDVLTYLKETLESRLGTAVGECLVLSSSIQVRQQQRLRELKLSFHVHMRLQDGQVFANVTEFHRFMRGLKEELEGILRSSNSSSNSSSNENDGSQLQWHSEEEVKRARMLLKCIDFGVYSRWRALRLPYNVKCPLSKDSFTLADAAADELLQAELEATGLKVPEVTVGAIGRSVMEDISLSQDIDTCAVQLRLLAKMLFMFRVFLPIIPGVTQLSHAGLKRFLELHAPLMQRTHSERDSACDGEIFASAVVDLACVQRDASVSSTPFRVLHVPSSGTSGDVPSSSADLQPFVVPMPPMRHSVRVPVHDRDVKKLMVEVFECISPHYGSAAAQGSAASPWGFQDTTGRITPEKISVQYEESIRAYYVTQNENKFCIRQSRFHKSTFSQLYLTYGSVKVRCYSNDCHDRCFFVQWSEAAAASAASAGNSSHFSAGYPLYKRLAEIRDRLFPSLPPDELLRRYGSRALQSNTPR